MQTRWQENINRNSDGSPVCLCRSYRGISIQLRFFHNQLKTACSSFKRQEAPCTKPKHTLLTLLINEYIEHLPFVTQITTLTLSEMSVLCAQTQVYIKGSELSSGPTLLCGTLVASVPH